MIRLRPASALFFTALFSLQLFAQTPQKPAASAPAEKKADRPKPDYSQEPFVIELFRNAARFENDGTGVRELEVRVRVQSEAGVRVFGQLAFGYNSANEKMEINSVEVRKPDGAVTTAPPDAVQEMTAGVAREAPVYSDYRQKHVTVPALRPGDVLSYRVTTTIATPLAPGQFWLAHDFLKDAIVLAEQYEVNVPRDRAIKLKTLPDATPAITEEGARRIYRWTSANLKRESDEDEDSDAPKKKEKKPEFPAIQLTTFQNWAEVGTWYAGLERERAVATPAIRAKAEELVRDRKTDLEKIEGLYSFVAKDFRYVSLSFGVGRYQPHAAEEVLANQYGDCKDKHTLLEALIEAIGLHADPVLASATHKIDPDVPSPGQFDHVFTVIRASPDEKSWIWLDTTTEVAPFRLLSASLRKKQVLLVPMTAPAGTAPNAGAAAQMLPRLIETPADPPFPATQRVAVQGQVSELGKLTAKISYTLRGDTELILRSAFRRTPKSQWKDLARAIARSDGFNGEVTDVQASDPALTAEPFHIEIQISEPNFFDWTSHNSQLNLPLPRTGLPNVREPENDSTQSDEPIDFGSPLEITTRAELDLPAAFKAKPPVPVSVSRDYAEYSSAYKVEGGKLTAERTLHFRMRELPSARARDYLAFARAVRSDEDQTLSVETASAAKPAIPTTAKSAELYEAARAALQNSNFAAAIELLNRVVALEPKHQSAWNDLGRAYVIQAEFGRAAEYFRQQIEVNPYDPQAYLLLGIVLGQERKYTEAEAAFRKQIELNPLDRQAHAALGGVFLEGQKYAEAIPELEKGVTLSPQSADLRVALGRAYLNTGKNEEAMAAFDKAVELSPTPPVWNNISYELAKKNVGLDRAQQYAESAVAAVAAGLRNASLARLSLDDLQRVTSIGANWDTLGWVLFQRGDLARAERFIRAAWLLDQHGEVGDHLAQIYEKQGRKKESLDLYAQAVAATRPLPETKTKLLSLVGDEKKVASLTAAAGDALSAQRSIKLGNLKWDAGTKDTATAEFFVSLEPGASADAPSKVTDIKFISGDGSLRPLAEALRTARFPGFFPDATPTLLVRRGILSCSRQTHDCVFVLILPDSVHSVD
jgi:tetratricopeptide (TPR) repeat protein/transglutaminase-like putative cysteine protease